MSEPTRKEVAEREIGRTEFSSATSPLMIVAFLAVIAFVPIFQTASELIKRETPQTLDIVKMLPSWTEIVAARGVRSALSLLPSLKEISDYEDALEDESVIAGWVLPRMQLVGAKTLGLGNEQAYLGRDGWLFYRPGVDYVAGHGFLDAGQLKRRRLGGSAWNPPPQPDPIAALVDFNRQLAERGVTLVVMPTHVKPSLHPDRLSDRYVADSKPIQNPSYEAFLAAMEREGIRVFDMTTALESPLPYLKTDTHWSPETMERAADALASYLKTLDPTLAEPTARYIHEARTVTHHGDIASMLKLPESQTLYREESVRIHPVNAAFAEGWQPSPNADVLLLGDSFSNIYSFAAMGWGESAGLAEQLSFALQRPLDRIVQNAGGAYATRQELAQAMRRGEDRLDGKRVVVYQFAARELSIGDWKMIELPTVPRKPEPHLPTPVQPDPSPPKDDGALIVRGTVKATAPPPRPGSVPYADAVMSVWLTDLAVSQGELGEDEIAVFTWGMRGNEWTEAARLSVGGSVAFRLTAWDEVEGEYGSYQRMEILDDDALFLTPYWGEVSE